MHIEKNNCKPALFLCKNAGCSNRFTTETNMYRHARLNCKYKDIQIEENRRIINKHKNNRDEIYDSLIEKINILEKENKELKEQKSQNINCQTYIDKKVINNIDNKIVNNCTINVQNITLVAHNKEDISKIKDEMGTILQSGFYTSVKLTEAINFNPNYPEYHNVTY